MTCRDPIEDIHLEKSDHISKCGCPNARPARHSARFLTWSTAAKPKWWKMRWAWMVSTAPLALTDSDSIFPEANLSGLRSSPTIHHSLKPFVALLCSVFSLSFLTYPSSIKCLIDNTVQISSSLQIEYGNPFRYGDSRTRTRARRSRVFSTSSTSCGRWYKRG